MDLKIPQINRSRRVDNPTYKNFLPTPKSGGDIFDQRQGKMWFLLQKKHIRSKRSKLLFKDLLRKSMEINEKGKAFAEKELDLGNEKPYDFFFKPPYTNKLVSL